MSFALRIANCARSSAPHSWERRSKGTISFCSSRPASLVFGPLFFPGEDPVLSTLSSFLAFAVGFIARPLGAVLFGHMGDRYGRRLTLVVTILTMGVAKLLMGLLPTYASVGLAAPVCLVLLRALQGVAAGGEWSGATLIAIENAAPARHGFYAATAQMSSPAATLLSSGAAALATSLPKNGERRLERDFVASRGMTAGPAGEGGRVPIVASFKSEAPPWRLHPSVKSALSGTKNPDPRICARISGCDHS